jgi:hypothetical protein
MSIHPFTSRHGFRASHKIRIMWKWAMYTNTSVARGVCIFGVKKSKMGKGDC